MRSSPRPPETDTEHALAEVISDMQFLSQKIRSFCLQFGLARRRQWESPGLDQQSASASTLQRKGN
jgi:hypothetical protein